MRKSAPKRQTAFSRDEIVACALKMLATEKIEALTLRGVARELGCLPGTINYHFENLADLQDAIAASLVERLPVLDAARPQPIKDQLVELSLALIDVISVFPTIRNSLGPISYEIAARQLQQYWLTMQGLGLSEDEAVLFMDMLQAFARSRGSQMHRLRTGGEAALRMEEALLARVGRPAPKKFKKSDFTAQAMEPFHREYVGMAMDALLAGFPAQGSSQRRTKSGK